MSAGIQVIKNFDRKGFRMLGSGCYAAVFESNSDPNIVYKVGITAHDPYLAYIQSGINSPHFPKVHRLFVDIANDYYIVTMERLSPVPEHKIKTLDAVRGQFDNPSAEYKPVVDCVNQLINAFEDFKLDLHSGNIMMRGFTFVVTDPISNQEISESKDLGIWMDNYGESLHKSVSA